MSNPLYTRYASKEMQNIFSNTFRAKTFRKLWLILAQSEKELNLDVITDEMIEDMKNHIEDIDFDEILKYEKELKHDVMAHIYAFSDKAKKARKIIHLGATSAYVGDNTDLIQIKEALELVKRKLVNLMYKMADFASKYKDLPTLGFTHFQPAQLTTLGKRASLWIQSLLFDFNNLEYRIENLKFRGVKGTTGTQASYKKLFSDYDLVKKLDDLVTKKAGFKNKQTISSQTYDRKQDSFILELLSDIAQSIHKITNDFRLLQHLKEIEEPFDKKQVGSSAMAYKRNPIKNERASSLCKFVISNSYNGSLVAMTQWLERSLDDSANKRLSISQSFLAIDGILDLMLNIFSEVVVYPKIIEKNIQKELLFIATENILMSAVKKGLDRQEVHEIIRELSMKAVYNIKVEGLDNNLLDLIKNDKRLEIIHDQLDNILDYKEYIGYSVNQVEDFLENDLKPIFEKYKEFINKEIVKIEI